MGLFSPFSHNSTPLNPLDNHDVRRNIYKHIVNSLLHDRRQLKKVEGYFDPVEYDILRTFCKKNRILSHVVTSNYLVINLTYDRIIVIGYDRSRGKLFVNLHRGTFKVDECESEEIADRMIRETLFNYDVDVDVDEYVISASEIKTYRVQGDMVVTANPLLGEDFKSAYTRSLLYSADFYRSYARYLLFRISRLLTSMRIAHEMHLERFAIEIPRTLYKYSLSFSENMKKFTELLGSLLCNNLGSLCSSVEVYSYVDDGWGNSYKRIEIRVERVALESDLVISIGRLVEENIRKENYTLYFGNHVVEVKNAYPRTVRVVYDNHEFTMSTDLLYVTPETEIVITHDQHGRVVIRFDKYYALAIGSTNSAWSQDRVFTTYVIKDMLKRYAR